MTLRRCELKRDDLAIQLIVIFGSLTEVADEKKLNATPNKLLLIKYIFTRNVLLAVKHKT